MVSDSHVAFFSVYINLTSQPISERLRKAVFRYFRSDNLMFAFVKMQNE